MLALHLALFVGLSALCTTAANTNLNLKAKREEIEKIKPQQRLKDNRWFTCPPGSILDLDDEKCHWCAKDSFQPLGYGLHMQCTNCSADTETMCEGSISETECKSNEDIERDKKYGSKTCKNRTEPPLRSWKCGPGSFAFDNNQTCSMCPRGEYTEEYGSETCNKCKDGKTTQCEGSYSEEFCEEEKRSDDGDCSDWPAMLGACVDWKIKGQCEINDAVRKQCAKTCGLCSKSKAQTTSTRTDCKDWPGMLGACVDWKIKGQCEINDAVRKQCAKTCELCSQRTEDTEDRTDDSELCDLLKYMAYKSTNQTREGPGNAGVTVVAPPPPAVIMAAAASVAVTAAAAAAVAAGI